MFDPETTARLLSLRQKAIANTATDEELAEGLRLLRQGRAAAQAGSTKSRATKAAAAAPVDTASVLAGLKQIGQNLMSGPVA